MIMFLHEEANGKKRLRANGKGGGHNKATSEEETIFVINTSFCLDVTRAIVRAILEENFQMSWKDVEAISASRIMELLPEWAEFGLGCDDMVDAFRQCPIAPGQQGVNVCAYYSMKKKAWRLVEVFGMVYGMRSSVVHFPDFQHWQQQPHAGLVPQV